MAVPFGVVVVIDQAADRFGDLGDDGVAQGADSGALRVMRVIVWVVITGSLAIGVVA
ncbi:hypothetical protein [Pilimelia columellifera]|uniref:Uncharacterized protein n=1 Tax=Pilimelia columellifera subsp. columellifera TaxID=706583 RepID=A0ABP6AL59_9ACTN